MSEKLLKLAQKNLNNYKNIKPTYEQLQQKLLASQASEARLCEALVTAEKIIVKAIMFESEAEQYLSESNYELNGCLGDSAADISVNGKNVLLKVREALSTPLTTAELEAYVESEIDKRFEVAAYAQENLNDIFQDYKVSVITREKSDNDGYNYLLPLYVKKG